MDEETRELIVTVKKIIAVETGDPEKAEALEENATKIMIKAHNLYKANIVTEEDFKEADEPLRKALRLIVKVYDGIHKLPQELQKKTLEEKFYVIAYLFEKLQTALKTILSPHLQEASIKRIDDTFDIMANHEFFHNVWNNDSLSKEVELCMDFLRDLDIHLDRNKK